MANTRVFTGADNLTGFEKLVSDLLISNELTLDHHNFRAPTGWTTKTIAEGVASCACTILPIRAKF